MNAQLMKRAVRLFPKTDYTDAAAVRHARRQWLRSVLYLRCQPGGSKWAFDRFEPRLQ